MDRDALSLLAHADHPIAAPVGPGAVAELLRRTRCPAGARILDLGCGQAAWTVRALREYPDATADGVDISERSLRGAERAARDAGVADRLRLHCRSGKDFPTGSGYDLVLCVGATHAFGGLAATVDALAGQLRPGGLALVGDGFWERPPTGAALAALEASPAEFADLAGTVDLVQSAGWTPVYAHVSAAGEWQDYEWSWTGSLSRWALEHPADPESADVLATARRHREEWLRGYRDVLGFVCLLLSRTAD